MNKIKREMHQVPPKTLRASESTSVIPVSIFPISKFQNYNNLAGGRKNTLKINNLGSEPDENMQETQRQTFRTGLPLRKVDMVELR